MAFFLRKVGGFRFGKEQDRESRVSNGSRVSSEAKEGMTVEGVWGSNGKVFIGTDKCKQLEVTNSVPRPRWTERYSKITDKEGSSSPIVAVIPNPSNQNQVYVIYINSITDCFETTPQTTHQWTRRHTFQLSNAKGAEILTVAIHPYNSMFFWCENRASTLGLSSCCVCMREVPDNWEIDVASSVGTIAVIIHSCPSMSLFVINKGICLVPHLPDEQNRLLLYWTFVPRALKAQIWNFRTVLDLVKTDFKSIIRDLLPVWHSVESNYILNLTAHPSTLELLLLDNTFSLSYVVIREGKPLVGQLCVLSTPFRAENNQIVRHIFALGLFVGLVWQSGVIDVFDSQSGTALYALTELTGVKLDVWTCAGTVPGIGVWSSRGIWDFKSGSVLDVVEILQTSVRSSVTTNRTPDIGDENYVDISVKSSEDTTRFNMKAERICTTSCSKCQCTRKYPTNLYPVCKDLKHGATPSGPVAATTFLRQWRLFPLEAKAALSSIISKMILDSSENSIEKVLLDKVVGGSFQSPVFSLILFFNHPLYKDLVIKEVQNFVEKYQSNENSDQKYIKTQLNSILFPYMNKFVSLAKKFDEILDDSEPLIYSFGSEDLPSDPVEAKAILCKLSLSKPESESIFRLYFLHCRCPKDVVESVVHHVGLQSSAVNENKTSLFSQQWRNIYRLEWKDGQWQKSRASLEDSNNPFLSLLCNMLYCGEPDWLFKVREYGLAVVNAKDFDERAQDHIHHSFLDCLPALKVDANQNSTHVHSKLLWAAGQEMQAMQILLRHKMWSQALDFFTSLPKDTNSIILLFTMMFKAFLRCRAPKEVSLRALDWAPHGICTYEILSILQDNGSSCTEPFESSKHTLTIGDARLHLQKLIT